MSENDIDGVELRKDVLGPVPVPLNGGDTSYLQLGAHVGKIRVQCDTSLGVKIPHATFQGKMHQVLMQLEGTDRVKAVVALETAKGITRTKRQEKGKTEYVVYMSDDEKSKRSAKTLEETLSQRAEAISFPEKQLAKVDAFWLKEHEFKEATLALHEDKHACLTEVPSSTAPTFRALEERAAAFKEQAEEKDTRKQEQLKKSAEVELSFTTEKLAECRQRKAELSTALGKLSKQCDRLKSDAVHLALDANADIATVSDIQLKRRRIMATIAEKEGEIASLDNIISDYESNAKALKKITGK